MIKYIDTPTHSIAFNHKAGTMSICVAVAKAFYPDLLAGLGSMPHLARFVLPMSDIPTKPVLLTIREPIERFRSACATLDVTPDQAFTLLDEPHFLKQSDYMVKGAQVFRFPEQLKEFAETAGLDEIPQYQATLREKPSLTDKQLTKIRAHYADDFSLFDASESDDA